MLSEEPSVSKRN